MAHLWDKPGVPHAGWLNVNVYDVRGDGRAADETIYHVCEMCGNEQVRFVHVMEHPEFDGRLEVGCVCAEKMSGDYVTPRRREGKIRSRAGRRAKWLTRKWKRSRKGNSYLKVDNIVVTVFPNKFREGWWKFSVGDSFSSQSYRTEDAAKLAAFDEFWVQLEAQADEDEDWDDLGPEWA